MYSLLHCTTLGKLSLQPTRGIVSNAAFPMGRLPRGLPHLSALHRNFLYKYQMLLSVSSIKYHLHLTWQTSHS